MDNSMCSSGSFYFESAGSEQLYDLSDLRCKPSDRRQLQSTSNLEYLCAATNISKCLDYNNMNGTLMLSSYTQYVSNLFLSSQPGTEIILEIIGWDSSQNILNASDYYIFVQSDEANAYNPNGEISYYYNPNGDDIQIIEYYSIVLGISYGNINKDGYVIVSDETS